jgi:hypothetical protein
MDLKHTYWKPTMSINVERLGLIISPSLQLGVGNNINGPCCIVVPKWCASRLGNYYLYFADHAGSYIKMAFAQKISGPWTLYQGGVLDLSGFADAYDHIASPDILIDTKEQKLRLYFHSRSNCRGREQATFAAVSSDGLVFKPLADIPLAPFYLKLFSLHGQIYGMSKGGNLWRSLDGVSPFEPGGNPFDRGKSEELWHNQPGSIRHVGLSIDKNTLTVYFTRIGDAPERILRCNIELSQSDWRDWEAGVIEEVMRPEEDYEGSSLPVEESVSGPENLPANALRDPHILKYNGDNYIFYSVCGEQGIAVCKIVENKKKDS